MQRCRPAVPPSTIAYERAVEAGVPPARRRAGAPGCARRRPRGPALAAGRVRRRLPAAPPRRARAKAFKMKRLALRTLQFAIAVAISIGGLIATHSRDDLATEAIVIALIGLSLIGIVSGRLASPARDHLSRIHRSRHILVLELGHQQYQKVIVTERVGRSAGGSRRSRRGGSGRGNRGYGHDFALSGGLRGGDFAARPF
jgi:hypothetical protein